MKIAAGFYSLILLGAQFAAPVCAAQETVHGLYVNGDYEGAVAQASRIGGAENFVLAARALNATAYFEDDRKVARRAAKRAFDFSRAASKLDDSNAEAHLQAAISMAVRGANMSPTKAFFLRLPSRSRKFIDRALALEPNNSWALSTSAAWRLEVARRGGGRLYGADPEAGYAEFLIARKTAPANLVIAYECALRLLASDRADWRPVAVEALQAALDGVPKTAFEAAIQARALDFQAAINMGGDAERAFIEAQL